MSKTYKVTKAHRKKWELFVEKWQRLLGLTGFEWQLTYEDDEDNYATFIDDYDGGVIKLNLSTSDSEKEITDVLLDRIAFHELYEIFLYELLEPIRRDASPRVWATYKHQVHKRVRVFENILF